MQARARAQCLDNIGPQAKRPLPELHGSGSPGVSSLGRCRPYPPFPEVLGAIGGGREIYPFCPTGRERLIAEHACRKYSGRVGRSAAAKTLDKEAVRLALTAHVRHAETNYDDLLLDGIERWDAREKVYSNVSRILDRWEHGGSKD